MKPAKYKAKNLKGQWVYGTPIETRPSIDNKFGFHKWWMIETACSHGGYFYICKRSAIDEKTLCEMSDCTDINSKPICMNDRVHYIAGGNKRTAEVTSTTPNSIILSLPNEDTVCYDNDAIRKLKLTVIGNKYD